MPGDAMRIGMNPLRNQQAQASADTVVSVITHLPNLDGYHEHRLEVVKLSLMSLRAHSDGADIAVWDNGSCKALTSWLSDHFKPTQLILSNNIGKQAARTALLRMYHPETVVGISDDDMLFYPGWLDASVQLLNTYPNVGIVSAYPVRTQFRWGCKNTRAWAQVNARYSVGRFIPAAQERDFADSIGRPWEQHVMSSINDYDHQAVYKGVPAYLTGHHCQFICVCGRLQPFLSWNHAAMPDEKPFDIAIDNAGLLRLTTTGRYARHIGNVIDESIRADAEEMGLL